MTLIVRDVCSIDASHSFVLVIKSFSESSLLSDIDRVLLVRQIFSLRELKRNGQLDGFQLRLVLFYCTVERYWWNKSCRTVDTHIPRDSQLQPIISLHPGGFVGVESERVSRSDILRVCVSWIVSCLEVFSVTLALTMTRRHT